jgi:antirestriction protein ArdC
MKTTELHENVTNSIIKMLEAGTKPWESPFAGCYRGNPLRQTGERYKGINTIVLWAMAEIHGFTGKHWFTYKQAKDLGAQVRKGEKSSPIVFYSTIEKENTENEKPDIIPFLKSYSVFNACQIDGLPEDYTLNMTVPYVNTDKPIPSIDKYISSIGAEITNDVGRAYYLVESNTVNIPPFEKFKNAEGYYSTALHELIHWTGHSKRLNRANSPCKNKDEAKKQYAFEELVAEIGAAFLCADLGITTEPREDHAAYLASWLSILKADNKAIFKAAAAAQKACDYLHNCQASTITERVAA